MKEHMISARVAGMCLAMAALAMPAAAQSEARGEISAGYELLGGHQDDSITIKKGWYADVEGSIGRLFGVVFQVSGHYKTVEGTDTVQGITTTLVGELKIHDFMGGVRTRIPVRGRAIPFAQFLIGGVNERGDVSGSIGGQPISYGDSRTFIGLQAGGGVSVRLPARAGLRFSAHYSHVFEDVTGMAAVNWYRVGIGAVFAL